MCIRDRTWRARWVRSSCSFHCLRWCGTRCSFGRGKRDVCGADVATAGQRRQPLDMHAEQAGEQPGLGLAQLREAGGDDLDRAVTLAELDGPATWQGPNGGRVAVHRQAVGEGRHAPDDVVPGRRDDVTMTAGDDVVECVMALA